MTDETVAKKAVIYCRVSTRRQTSKGDGLSSQETSCSEYARRNDLEVVRVFKDTKSGRLIDRPGMNEMLSYLRKHRKQKLAVIVEDISRLARGMEAHVNLEMAITKAGGELLSPRADFRKNPTSILVRNIMASVAENFRLTNAETSRSRTRARLLNGYWTRFAPRGYKYTDGEGGGRVLVRDEPLASIIAEGLEGYASGRFQLKAELKRFWERFPEFPKNSKGGVTNQEVNRILNRIIYAGYIESEVMDISLRPAKHEPLISLETYEKIQRRMQEGAYVPARKNLDAEFPLRGFVACDDCGKPMTACFSKGRSKHYAYYYCVTNGCESRAKTINRDKLEGEFETLLGSLTPAKGVMAAASAMFRNWWDHIEKAQTEHAAALKAELRATNRKMDSLVDRIVDADSDLVSSYEKKLKKLDRSKHLLQEQIKTVTRPKRTYDETLRTALDFLKEPQKLWDSEHLEDKRAVLKLTFGERLRYRPDQGFRTAKTTLPFRYLSGFSGGDLQMAERGGFEPSAFLYISMAQRGAASRSSLPLGRNPHPSALMAYRLRGRRPHDSNRQQRHCDLPVASGHRACLDHILPHLRVPSTMSGTTPKRHHSTASSRRTTRSFSPGSKPKAAHCPRSSNTSLTTTRSAAGSSTASCGSSATPAAMSIWGRLHANALADCEAISRPA